MRRFAFLLCALAACSDATDTLDSASDAGTANTADVGGLPSSPGNDAGERGSGNDAGSNGVEADAGAGSISCTGDEVLVTVFADTDGDGYGSSMTTADVCLASGEQEAGYARQAGDCRATDPFAHPGAIEICGDYVDDDCSSGDQPCPTTNTADIDVPAWNCLTSPPPANVYAHALFTDGLTYFQPNACFVFFEGLPNEFYVQRVNLTRVNTSPSCETITGCTCPSSTSYDRRMYAVTKSESMNPCAQLSIQDHGGETQPVSNDCRKFLYQLHWPQRQPPPYSFVAPSVEAIEQRITLFPTVEVVCAANPPNTFLPFASLMSATIEKNAGFVKK